MRVAGIIAEYNPLHHGHVFHMKKTIEATQCDAVIVVLSGDFVQRGEPAIADKFTRAQWALQAGADLVLELPAICAIASAERFAYGGVRILAGTGVLDALCFGSETVNMDALQEAAHMIAHEEPAFRSHLRDQLALGKSYPRARYDALQAFGAPSSVLSVMRTPNSILGMEYLRFLATYAPHATPVAILRTGNQYHDTSLDGAYLSATAIREGLQQNDPQKALDGMPMYVSGRFNLADIPSVGLRDAEQLILYALKCMTPEALGQLPDVNEGFENVLYRAARQSATLDEFFKLLKSKRYTLARCKRIALYALLQIKKSHMQTLLADDALYLRVLGFNRNARSLLSAIGKRGTLPLITRRSDIATISPNAKAFLEIDMRAHEIYALLNGQEQPLKDFAQPPVTP